MRLSLPMRTYRRGMLQLERRTGDKDFLWAEGALLS